MRYKMVLFGLVFLSIFLFLYNNSLEKNLGRIRDQKLSAELCKNKNIRNFVKNFSDLKIVVNKCSKYNYEYFYKFCSSLGNKLRIKDLCVKNTEIDTTQYLNIFRNLVKLISIEVSFSADKEESITKFIDLLLSRDFFVYHVNECVIYKSNNKYCIRLNMILLTINLENNITSKNFIFIDSEKYPLKIMDRKICYTGLVRIGACARVYVNNNDVLNCFSKNTKFSLTKYTDSFIIFYVNKLKKNFKLYLGKEEYIHP